MLFSGCGKSTEVEEVIDTPAYEEVFSEIIREAVPEDEEEKEEAMEQPVMPEEIKKEEVEEKAEEKATPNDASEESVLDGQADNSAPTNDVDIQHNIEPIKEEHEHAWVKKTLSEATCDMPKRVQDVCSVCGATKEISNEGTAMGHDFSIYVGIVNDATCISTGNAKYQCTRCGMNTWKTIEYKDHAWDGGRVLVEGDCTTAHIVEYTCTVCGLPRREEDAQYHANDHQWVEKIAHVLDEEKLEMVDVTVIRCAKCNAAKE